MVLQHEQLLKKPRDLGVDVEAVMSSQHQPNDEHIYDPSAKGASSSQVPVTRVSSSSTEDDADGGIMKLLRMILIMPMTVTCTIHMKVVGHNHKVKGLLVHLLAKKDILMRSKMKIMVGHALHSQNIGRDHLEMMHS
ncbi:hypothetical protein ACLOJK_041371 [Asimina triloba]